MSITVEWSDYERLFVLKATGECEQKLDRKAARDIAMQLLGGAAKYEDAEWLHGPVANMHVRREMILGWVLEHADWNSTSDCLDLVNRLYRWVMDGQPAA